MPNLKINKKDPYCIPERPQNEESKKENLVNGRRYTQSKSSSFNQSVWSFFKKSMDTFIDTTFSFLKTYFTSSESDSNLKKITQNSSQNSVDLNRIRSTIQPTQTDQQELETLSPAPSKLDMPKITELSPAEIQEVILTIKILIEEIQEKARTDLDLSEKNLETKYHIYTLINTLPETKAMACRGLLNDVINTENLVKFQRNKRQILEPQNAELHVLKILDYSNKKDLHADTFKDDIYDGFIRNIQEKLTPEDYKKSPSEFTQLLKDYALESRLNRVGISEKNQIDKFKQLLLTYRNQREKLRDLMNEISLTFPDDFPRASIPLKTKKIQNHFESIKLTEGSKILREMFNNSDIKESFQDGHLDPQSFMDRIDKQISLKEESLIEELIEKCRDARANKKLNSQIALFTQWGPFLKSEMIQGFSDSNEVLGVGVCRATCFRLLNELQLTPDKEIDEELSVTAKDRFRQAMYATNISIIRNEVKHADEAGILVLNQELIDEFKQLPDEIQPEWLHGTPFQKSSSLFKVDYNPNEQPESNLFTILNSNEIKDSLNTSNGWMLLGLQMSDGGHAALMRLDQERGKAWFFDPNIGLFCFERPDKTFENAKIDCLNCFKEMSQSYYPSLNEVNALQLIPK